MLLFLITSALQFMWLFSLQAVSLGNRRLQPFRHLHDCSDCFGLERSPGGTCTHWKSAALPRRTPVGDIDASQEIEHWSPTTLREKVVKIGAKVVRHDCYIAF